MSKRLIQRRWCNLLLPRKYVRFQNLVVVLIGVITMLLLVLLYETSQPHSKWNLRTRLTARARRHKLFKKNFGNNSAACRLPNLDPFHSSVAQFMKDLGRLNCDGVSYSSFENNVLVVEGEGIVSAQYRKIARAPGDDFAVVLSDPLEVRNDSWSPMDKDGSQKGLFKGSASIDADFIRVDVVINSGERKTDVHMHVFPKQEVLERPRKPVGIPLNVALVMFDSTSAANFVRKMPSSLEYLNKSLGSVFMQGETIVGDGTTAQLSAMLTGVEEKRQVDARRRITNSQPVDSWRWIFKDYKDKGYATMFSEDSPYFASFNYRLHGFKDPPTDHYARPFWMEADNHINGYCINNRASYDVSLKYLLSLFRRYRDTPKFGFSSHAVISHDDPNTVGYADADLKSFLETFEKETFRNNTLLIIFADHGARFSDLRKTIQGKLEERFPFLSITTPKWFPEKYPDLYNSLVHNSRVLTSPFDVYATLRHILSYPEYPTGILIGQSLFTKIDERNRTCASAGVEDHWCPCLNLEEISTDEQVVFQAATFVLNHINSLTSQTAELSAFCQRLTLKEIKSAFRDMPSEAMQRFRDTKHPSDDACDYCEAVMGDKAENTLVKDTLYQLRLLTAPNNGFYEASVRITRGVPSIVGDISRIDAYKDQPYCIQDRFPLLRKFCYCYPTASLKA